MNNNAEIYIAITHAVKKQWIQEGLNESKIKVIYNGIRDFFVLNSKEIPKINELIRIVMVGRIELEKGESNAV